VAAREGMRITLAPSRASVPSAAADAA